MPTVCLYQTFLMPSVLVSEFSDAHSVFVPDFSDA